MARHEFTKLSNAELKKNIADIKKLYKEANPEQRRQLDALSLTDAYKPVRG